jgi:hypothetical protein
VSAAEVQDERLCLGLRCGGGGLAGEVRKSSFSIEINLLEVRKSSFMCNDLMSFDF